MGFFIHTDHWAGAADHFAFLCESAEEQGAKAEGRDELLHDELLFLSLLRNKSRSRFYGVWLINATLTAAISKSRGTDAEFFTSSEIPFLGPSMGAICARNE